MARVTETQEFGWALHCYRELRQHRAVGCRVLLCITAPPLLYIHAIAGKHSANSADCLG
jgi:hypothetical protein